MTNAAYRAKYQRLRAHLGEVALSEQAVVRKSFKTLGQPIADAVRRIPATPSLGDEDRKRILSALDRNALFDAVKASIVSGVKKGGKYIVDLDTAYVWEAVQKAKAEKRFKEAGIRKVFDRQLERIVKRKANTGKMMPLVNVAGQHVYSNRAGYTLSSSIWKVVSRFEAQIMAIVEGGLNQGRDGRDISGDLMAYIIGGPDAILGRWGNLMPGTAEYVARLGSAGVDYRAMRLVRSEMYSSLQEDAVSSGRANPAGNGLFDWILQAGRIDWGCDCPSLADGGPYEADSVPDYPHPNCHTAGTKIATNRGLVDIESVLPGDVVISPDGSLNQVTHTWKTNYDGFLVKLGTRHGEVECTLGHPLLSGGRWTSAHILDLYDYLTRIDIGVPLNVPAKNISRSLPSKTGKESGFFRISEFLFGGVVPVTAIDFDGETYIREREIGIEDIDGKVGDRLFTKSDDGIIEKSLIPGPEFSGVELRFAGELFLRNLPTPDGIMGGPNVGDAPVGVASGMSLADGRKGEPELQKIAIDNVSGYSENLGNRIDREILVAKKVDKHGFVNVNSSTHDDEIILKTIRKFKGYVYNLSVEKTHSFIANGFASHNCFCTVAVQLIDHDQFVDSLADFVAGRDTQGARGIEEWAQNFYDASA